MLRKVPVWKQAQLSVQQSFIVGRQDTRFRRQLPRYQSIDSLHVKRMVGLRIFDVNGGHHGLVAQVSEQHETLRFLPCQNLGGFEACQLHEFGNFDKGFTVFFVGRCVHDNQAGARLCVNAQITPEAGIGRCNS